MPPWQQALNERLTAMKRTVANTQEGDADAR
jgi:hypothetical protein